MAMFPIRCVVETIADGQCTKCSSGGSVLVDSYAIVSGFTQLSQLVETVLTALGLQHLCYGAQGTIQVKNWRPLTFEEVTSDPDIEVENLLKDISNHLTLRITAKQSDSAVSDCVRDMKDRLLQTVWHKLPHVASEIHQPQLKELVTNLVQGDGPQAIDAQLMYMFNMWLEQMNKGNKNGMGPMPAWASNGRAAQAGQTSSRFSPTLEIPKLERWFRENQNPTRQKLLQYMTLMNNSSYRKHTAKITYQQICNWFINARASLRKRAVQQARRGDSQTAATVAATTASSTGTGGPSAPAIDDHQPEAMQTDDPSSSWPGRPLLPPKSASGSTLSFNSLMSSKLSAALTDGGGGGGGGPVAPATLDSSGLSEGGAGDGSPPTNGQRSPSASSRTSAVDMGKDDGSGADELTIAAQEQDLCPPLYFNSISMAPRPDGTGGAGVDGPELSVSPLMENGGGSSSGAATPSSTPYGSGVNANRTRLMFDPLTELPMLERWFEENPHPSWVQVDQFTEMLNVMPYRQTYPPVSAHNVKIWFKNRRAKFKRNLVGAVKTESSDSPAAVN